MINSQKFYEDTLISLGTSWKKPINPSFKEHKFNDRFRSIQLKCGFIHSYCKEYLSGGKDILDISSGNGVFLDIFRNAGNSILGIDLNTYKDFIDSEDIPFKEHNCSEFPYPVKDKSNDLVTCIGAITFYKPCSIWKKVMNEFARISRETIIVHANHGPVYDEYGHLLDEWSNPDWILVEKMKSLYIWKLKRLT